ncbi:cell division protein SepF [Bacillus solimangrovi]|uniref:Cell division protein SepF n=1 Tax=Bacillus solimangrovi TaxID=1305675 RepID=A0A1E5LAR0_9BACI|nr:cell division protein SepF [Bacillus solimangrovi]OEH91182.1 cell division protein SepF [Bacillus solimangrovi]
MSFMGKIKNFFALEDEYEYEYVEEDSLEHEQKRQTNTKQNLKEHNQQNVVSLQSVQQASKVVLVEPRNYDEVQEIADQLNSRRAVVINLQRVNQQQRVRIVDFLSGTVYAIGGDIKKLGAHTFLCTPDNIDISGTISEMMSEQEFDNDRW